MNYHKTRNKLLARLSGICFNDNGSGGDSGDGGAGASVDNGGGTSPGFAETGGGQVQEPANHQFNSTPAPQAQADHAARVSTILKKNDQEPLSLNEIADLISFDTPFTKPGAPATPAPAQAQTTPAQTPAQTPPAQTPAQAPQQPALDPNVAALVEALKGVVPGQGQQTPANTTPTDQEPKPYYGGQVEAVQVSPDLIKALIGTDDPTLVAQAAPAVNALTNGIMNRVMADAEARIQAYMGAVVAAIPQQVQQVQTVSRNEERFYSLHPELDKPAFKQTVNSVAQAVLTAARKKDPNFQLNDDGYRFIGNKVHELLSQQLGVQIPRGAAPTRIVNAPAAGPQPQQSAPAAPRQPFFSNGAARPPAASDGSQSADLVNFVL